MPWNSGGANDEGPGHGPTPWGTPGSRRPGGGRGEGGGGPWSGGRGTPPNLEEAIRRMQAWLRGFLPPGWGGGRGPRGPNGSGTGGGRGRFSGQRGVVAVVLVLLGLWLASGFYRVEPDQQGVVLRFGAYSRTTLPGLNYHLPWPIESVLLPAVTRINRVEIGYRGAGADSRRGATPAEDVPEESLMLTGDENIIDINFAVFWRIRDAKAFLFNTRDPTETVKAASESVMREVIGRTPIEPALGPGRSEIEQEVMKGVQAILDDYGTGIELTQVSLLKSNPPPEVIESFRDVQRANTDAEKMRNVAQAYANNIVPRARGDAAGIVASAEADRQASIARAKGQAQRFLSVLHAYEVAKDVTLKRLYIETMQDILSHTPTVVMDPRLHSLLPLLNLDAGGGKAAAAPPAPPPSTPGLPSLRGTP